MNSVQKQAKKDANEYAAAYMAYGDGAGTRRKLIEGTVDYKMHHIPGYAEAFTKESQGQDMAAHAKAAKNADRRKTVNTAVARNTKAVVSGKYENINTGILLVGVVAVILHKTGHDKTVIEFTKKKYKTLRQRFQKTPPAPKAREGEASDDGKVYRITDV